MGDSFNETYGQWEQAFVSAIEEYNRKHPDVEEAPKTFDQSAFLQHMHMRDAVQKVMRSAKIITEETGYGQINIIISPDGIIGVTHQVWWKPPGS